jgi:hypothetical protein
MKLALVLLLAGSSAYADSTKLSPVAMDGPYKSQHEACVHATPCGGTKEDKKDPFKFVKPPKVATCGGDDLNGGDTNGKPTKLDHKVGDMTLQIASQSCAVPPGIRWNHNVYYAFVKRADGWWRSAPLWQFKYNDKYESGSMLIKWNDQTGRTFAGIMAQLSSGACMKHGSSAGTVEMMVRFEAGTKSPVVFAPLVVGERFSREIDKDNPPEDASDASDADCKPVKKSFELEEKWSGDDDLELKGPASWFGLETADGTLGILVDDSKKATSSAGKYHFTR